MSGWWEAVWSSLPITPLGLSSSPPHQLLPQTQGRVHAYDRTHTHKQPQLHNFCTPSLFFPHLPHSTARPEPPQTFLFLPHFAAPLLPCPCTILPPSFPDLAWQCLMNEALLLSSAGLVSVPQPVFPICSSLRRSVLPLYRLLEPCGTRWA